jgi:hypothetical protein
MSLLKLLHTSYRIVAVAYAMPLQVPFALRRINTGSEVKHLVPRTRIAESASYAFSFHGSDTNPGSPTG